VSSLVKQLHVRARVPSDDDFIRQAWISSFRWSWAAPRILPRDIASDAHGRLISRIMEYSPAWVASWANDPDSLVGFMVGASPVLHYVFVKSWARGQGVAGALLRAGDFLPGETMISHPTQGASRIRGTAKPSLAREVR